MYKKIFIEQKCVVFSSTLPANKSEFYTIVNTNECRVNWVKFLEGTANDAYFYLPKNGKRTFRNFKQSFENRKAAGGLVFNDNNQFLAIERLGKWDLPKGHLEKGEKWKRAAIREVEEECGIHEPTLNQKLATTWHVYTWKGKSVLKKTKWYTMEVLGNPVLTPQTEEGITQAVWMARNKLTEFKSNTWASLHDVLAAI